jgi:hypothetical protein
MPEYGKSVDALSHPSGYMVCLILQLSAMV